METTIVIPAHRNRISSRIRNPGNRSRFSINHNIRPFLNKIRRDGEFKSIKDVVTWLKSPEVFPCWQEFKHDCLNHLPHLVRKVKYASPVTQRLEQRVYRRRAFLSIASVNRLLEDDSLLKKLRRTSGDKRKWAFNCHVAWFIAGVYAKCWNAKRDEGSLYPLANQHCDGDDGRQPWIWLYPLTHVLKYLTVFEERQPGWGEEFGEEED